MIIKTFGSKKIRISFLYIIVVSILLFSQIHLLSAQIKIMPLGDSITKGHNSVSTDNSGYRDDLFALLTIEKVNFDFVGSLSDGIGFDTDHEGHDGYLTHQISKDVVSYLSANPPDIILFQIGTNDISSNVEPEKIRDNIARTLEKINTFNSNIKILLSTLIPRTDEKDFQTSRLNDLLEKLYLSKRDEGFQIYYAGINEIFKCDLNWKTNFFTSPDIVHPNDIGYNIMGQVWFNTIMNAINNNYETRLTDNFERKFLGITWNADPEIEIQNSQLINTNVSSSTEWPYMATYKGLRNPTSVGITWGENSDTIGINKGGLALLLDSPKKDASGFLAWITTSDNQLRLSKIENGSIDRQFYIEKPSQIPSPDPGDHFRVDIFREMNNLKFEYLINDTSAGYIFIPNPGIYNNFYSGILMRRDYSNQIGEFLAEESCDFSPPAQIMDLTVLDPTPTTVTLTWTATGDNGINGIASKYDIRYSTNSISDENDFESSLSVDRIPMPQESGLTEKIVLLDLLPETTYFFAIKVFDNGNNQSLLSNVPRVATQSGELFVDNFDRDDLGTDWIASDSIQIVNNELNNLSNNQSEWDLAIFKKVVNPFEVSYSWSLSSDTTGIDQGGIALMLDSPNLNTNGYLITRRTFENQIRLWIIIQGQNPSEPIIETPLLAKPKPGDEFKIVMSTDQIGNHFSVFINGWEDITLTDTSSYMDPTIISDFYSGVMLAGGRNNNIDDFKAVTKTHTVHVDDFNIFFNDYILYQNFPNPFNSSTSIQFYLPKDEKVEMGILNTKGQIVSVLINRVVSKGNHFVEFNPHNLPSGLYICQLKTGRFVDVKKIVYIK